MATAAPKTNTEDQNSLLVEATDMREFQLPAAYSALYPEQITEGGVMWLIRNKHRNGFNRCVRLIGGKNLVHVPSSVVWFANRT